MRTEIIRTKIAEIHESLELIRENLPIVLRSLRRLDF